MNTTDELQSFFCYFSLSKNVWNYQTFAGKKATTQHLNNCLICASQVDFFGSVEKSGVLFLVGVFEENPDSYSG